MALFAVLCHTVSVLYRVTYQSVYHNMNTWYTNIPDTHYDLNLDRDGLNSV